MGSSDSRPLSEANYLKGVEQKQLSRGIVFVDSDLKEFHVTKDKPQDAPPEKHGGVFSNRRDSVGSTASGGAESRRGSCVSVEAQCLLALSKQIIGTKDVVQRAKASIDWGDAEDLKIDAMGKPPAWCVPHVAWLNKLNLERQRRWALERLFVELHRIVNSQQNADPQETDLRNFANEEECVPSDTASSVSTPDEEDYDHCTLPAHQTMDELARLKDAYSRYYSEAVDENWSLQKEMGTAQQAAAEAQSELATLKAAYNVSLQETLCLKKEKETAAKAAERVERELTVLKAARNPADSPEVQTGCSVFQTKSPPQPTTARNPADSPEVQTGCSVFQTESPPQPTTAFKAPHPSKSLTTKDNAKPLVLLPVGTPSLGSRHLSFFFRGPNTPCKIPEAALFFCFADLFRHQTHLHIKVSQCFKDFLLSQPRLGDWDGQRAVYDRCQVIVEKARANRCTQAVSFIGNPFELEGVQPEDILQLVKLVGAVERSDENGNGWTDGEGKEWGKIEHLMFQVTETCHALATKDTNKHGNDIRTALSLGGMSDLVRETLQGDNRTAVARERVRETAGRLQAVREPLSPLSEDDHDGCLGRQRLLEGRVADSPFIAGLVDSKSDSLTVRFKPSRFALVVGHDEKDGTFVLKETEGFIKMDAQILTMMTACTFSLFFQTAD